MGFIQQITKKKNRKEKMKIALLPPDTSVLKIFSFRNRIKGFKKVIFLEPGETDYNPENYAVLIINDEEWNGIKTILPQWVYDENFLGKFWYYRISRYIVTNGWMPIDNPDNKKKEEIYL